MKVLIVDDDKDVNIMLQMFLEKKGVKVSAVESGKEALKTLETEEFDVICLDMLMPELSGYNTLQKIRKNPKTKDVKVAVLTAKELSLAERKELEDLNVLRYIQKSTHFVQDLERFIEDLK